MVIIAIAGIVIIGIIYYFFINSNAKPKQQKDLIPMASNRPQTAGYIPVPQLDVSNTASSGDIVLQTAQKPDNTVTEHKAVAPLPPVEEDQPKPVDIAPLPTQTAGGTAKTQQQLLQEQQARLKANIMLKNGGDGGSSANEKTDLNSNFTPVATGASNTRVTKVGNLSYVIVQGKIIESVLETPINTNLPGPIRAVVSRDVYSEKGENILVPKGSRLIGSFAQGVQNGSTRVAIQWKRIIMPNGYDINIQQAPGVDDLGQLGINGDAHREFLGIIGNAVLLSIMNVALAEQAQKSYNIQSSQTQTTTGTDGSTSTTSTSNPAQQAAQQQVASLGSTTQQWFTDNFQVKPYVTISQGTVIKVFVNQDIRFPSNVFSGINNLG
jgi:type IV secretion system protein VirB10